MKKIRAVFIGDVRFDVCPVFELNENTGNFEMLRDKEIKYSLQAVEEDNSGFLIFEIGDDFPKFINKKD